MNRRGRKTNAGTPFTLQREHFSYKCETITVNIKNPAAAAATRRSEKIAKTTWKKHNESHVG